ncbi:MAG: NAD(P)H-hydrate dehydratase [Bacteroidales bacterium]|nr:NAD(P)H-hydrate dehydratase [Bacteroidales bacterium]
MKLFTTQQIRDIDRYTIESEGVSAIELIERIAEGVAFEIESRWHPGKPIVIFAGPGYNGADALATARLLAEHGYRPEVYLFNVGGKALSPTCKAYRDALLALDVDISFTEITSTFAFPKLTPEHVIIDGIFGSGLRDNLKGGYVTLVQYINDSEATVVSIDLPTGMMADSNPMAVNRNIIHATLTLAIQFPRIAFFNPDNAELVGEWKIIDVGLSETAIEEIRANYYLVEAAEVKEVLKPRKLTSSKADYGMGLLVGGSYGMLGAAVLAARGALRAGIGKLVVEAPKCGFETLQTAVPEAMYQYNHGDLFVTELNVDRSFDAIAIGPGLGTNDTTVQALENFLLTHRKPLVLDADALNCLSRRPVLLHSVPVLSILTPHAGEFDRLFGEQTSAEERLVKAMEVARFYSINIVLKGHHTAVIRHDGTVCFNSSGSPALATPGSGDVLTGIILALLAQGYKPELAAMAGVYIHGIAGELAAREHGEWGVTASDIAAHTGKAISMIMNHNKSPK